MRQLVAAVALLGVAAVGAALPTMVPTANGGHNGLDLEVERAKRRWSQLLLALASSQVRA